MAKSWMEVRVDTPGFLCEPLANFLIETGSPGLVQEKAPGPARRKRELLRAYFPDNRFWMGRRGKILTYLRELKTLHGNTIPFRARAMKEEKWAEGWKLYFQPVQATPRIVIKPSWKAYQGKKGETVITIDPGMAFGTGSHPSTLLCLRMLESLIPLFPFPPTLLDVGTGSGILAITAKKLGAGRVLAVDIDSAAVVSARRNAGLNAIGGSIAFRLGSLKGLRRVYDLVVANLLPQELLKIAAPLARRVSSGGVLILSGILRDQKKEIISAFTAHGLEVWRTQNLRGWGCLVLRRKRDLL